MADALKVAFGWPLRVTAAPTLSTFALDASNDAIEVIFQAYEAATISRLWYRHTAITGTAPVYQISLQGVDASGNPDGTIKASGNAKATFTPTAGNNNVGTWINLTSNYTCTRGEMLAIVLANSSGTINVSNFVTFTDRCGASNDLPYVIENNAGARARSVTDPAFGYGSSSLAYGNPVTGIGSTTFSDGSNPDEYALRFIVPATWFGSYKIAGVRAIVGMSATGNTLTWSLYDGTTLKQSFTHDTDHAQGVSVFPLTIYFTDATLATLTPGSVYRLAVKNNAAASTMTLVRHLVQANADLAAYPGGIEWYESTRNNGGAWSDVTATRPYIEPIFSDFTAASKPTLVDMQGGMAA